MGSVFNNHISHAFDNVGKQIISPIKSAHVVLRTSPANLKSQREFYLNFLGGRISYEDGTLCFITYDDEHHRLALACIPDIPPKIRNSCGLEHIAFSFNTLSDLLLSYSQRLQHNVRPISCVNHGPNMSMYYRDIDGNTLECQWDVWEDFESATNFMLSEEFKLNSIGTNFDPELMIERLKNGEEEEVLEIRPQSGPRPVPAFMLI